MRQVSLLTLVHSSARPFVSFAAKSCTWRSNSRTKYDPGVHTGITRSTDVAPGCFNRISTSSICVHGFGIETVYEISGVDVCAGDAVARKLARESAKANSATRFLSIGLGVESSGW